VANICLLIGAVLVAKPWLGLNNEQVAENSEVHSTALFTMVSDVQDIEHHVKQATERTEYTMLDLYADWCVACKEFEAYTFSDQNVLIEMKKMTRLQVDMTENNDKDIDIMEKYNVLGLPTIIFFDANGNEMKNARVTGFMNAEQFYAHLLTVMR
jgi:thiol:disulfide interchange protein DsbD